MECMREKKDPERKKAYMREYMRSHPELNKKNFKRWYRDNTNKHYKWKLAYARADPQRHRAQVYACMSFPERRVCEVADCLELGERHHDDYSQPYEIRWLCKKHHKLLHREEKQLIAFVV